MKESKLAASLKEELLLIHKKMTPGERLNAFFTHSQLLMRLFEEGENYRKRNTLNSGKNKKNK
jgi:hypothetical protein